MKRKLKIVLITLVAVVVISTGAFVYFFVPIGRPATIPSKEDGAYPRVAIYNTNIVVTVRQAKILAKWDLVVVLAETRTALGLGTPLIIRWMKQQNPDIKILADIQLAYLPPAPVPFFTFGDIYRNGDESWWLHYPDDPQNPKPLKERRFSLSGNTVCPNPTSEWSTFIVQYVRDSVMSTGLFDGIFYDAVPQGKRIVEQAKNRGIDINNDGVADDPDFVIQQYEAGMANLLKGTREVLGPEGIIIINGNKDKDSPYWKYINGNMNENALGTMWGNNPSWHVTWDNYERSMKQPSPPYRIHWIAADTNNMPYADFNPDLPDSELQKMRLGLTTTLLDDGYFGFDEGTGGVKGGVGHHGYWWFPEYDVNLGFPQSDAQEKYDGTWMRKFDNGLVIVNPTKKEINIDLGDVYKEVTTGIEGSQFLIPAGDGRIFLLVDKR